jgi:hypothetical protein
LKPSPPSPPSSAHERAAVADDAAAAAVMAGQQEGGREEGEEEKDGKMPPPLPPPPVLPLPTAVEPGGSIGPVSLAPGEGGGGGGGGGDGLEQMSVGELRRLMRRLAVSDVVRGCVGGSSGEGDAYPLLVGGSIDVYVSVAGSGIVRLGGVLVEQGSNVWEVWSMCMSCGCVTCRRRRRRRRRCLASKQASKQSAHSILTRTPPSFLFWLLAYTTRAAWSDWTWCRRCGPRGGSRPHFGPPPLPMAAASAALPCDRWIGKWTINPSFGMRMTAK